MGGRNNNSSRGGRGGGGRGRGRGRGHNGKGQSHTGNGGRVKFQPVDSGTYVSFEKVVAAVSREMFTKLKHHPKDIDITMQQLAKIDFTAEKPQIADFQKDDPTNPGTKIFKDEDSKSEYEYLRDDWRKRSADYETHMQKTAAIIHEQYCSEAMKDRLSARLDESEKLDLITLLTTIREAMHSIHKSEHPMKKLWMEFRKFLGCKQGQHEALDEYINRIREHRDIIDARLGVEWMRTAIRQNYPEEYEAIRTQPGSAEDKKEAFQELVEKKREESIAVLIIMNSYPGKYGSLISSLEGNYGRGTNQYPSTIEEARDTLQTHRWDKDWDKEKKPKKKGDKQKEEVDPNASNTSFANRAEQESIRCYKCGEFGHHSNKPCPNKPANLPYPEWWVNKALANIDEESDSDSSVDTRRSSRSSKKSDRKDKSEEKSSKRHVGGGKRGRKF